MGVDIQTYRAKIGTYRHSYGLDVVTLVFEVNFSHGLKTVGSVLFIGILLIMAGVEQNPGPKDFGANSATVAENKQPTKIRVTGLPARTTNEFLKHFFENEHKQGGGKVREVLLDGDGDSATVDFEDASAVDKVMQKQPIMISGTPVKVEVFVMDKVLTQKPIATVGTRVKIPIYTLTNSAEKIRSNKRGAKRVSNLVMGFEIERRQGGGPVRVVRTDDNHKQVAVAEFEQAKENKPRAKPPAQLSATGTLPSAYATSNCQKGKADKDYKAHLRTQGTNTHTSQQQFDANKDTATVNEPISVPPAQQSPAQTLHCAVKTQHSKMGETNTVHLRTQGTNTLMSQQQLDANNKTASLPVMDDDEIWDNSKYKNWVRGAKGLEFLQEGLKKFVGDTVLRHRDQTVQKLANAFSAGSPVHCNQCDLKNLLPEHARLNKQCNKNTCIQQVSGSCFGSTAKGRRKCPNGVCSKLYDEIVRAHRFKNPMWRNTDPSTWCSDPAGWSFAQCFQTTPSPGNSSAETDASGLLSIILTNVVFQNEVTCSLASKVNIFSAAREIRNEILHSPKMELEDLILQSHVGAFIDVLQDSKYLLHDQGAKESTQNLIQLKNNQITISQGVQKKLIEDRKHALVALKHLQEKEREMIANVEEKKQEAIVEIEGAKYAALQKISESDIQMWVEQAEARMQQLENTSKQPVEDEVSSGQSVSGAEAIGDDDPATKKTKALIDKACEMLIDYMNPDLILKCATAPDLFSYRQTRDIREENITTDKNRKILEKVRAKGKHGYAKLKKCLHESDQPKLVELLDCLQRGEDTSILLKQIHQKAIHDMPQHMKVNNQATILPSPRRPVETLKHTEQSRSGQMATTATDHKQHLSTQESDTRMSHQQQRADSETVNKQTTVLYSRRPPAKFLANTNENRSCQIGTKRKKHLGTQESVSQISEQHEKFDTETVNNQTTILPSWRPPVETLKHTEQSRSGRMATTATDRKQHLSTQESDTRMSHQQQRADSETVNKQTTVLFSRRPPAEILVNIDENRSGQLGTKRKRDLGTQESVSRISEQHEKLDTETAKKPTPLSVIQLSEVKTLADADKPKHDQMSTGATDYVTQVDTPEYTFGTSNEDTENDEHCKSKPTETQGEIFSQVLLKLGLVSKYPGKISIQDVIVADPNEAADLDKKCTSFVDIPWMILKKMICAHSDSRDITVSSERNIENNFDLDDTKSFIFDEYEEKQDISPLDIFAIVYQCCDPLMKRIFFQKLFLCKIAVPFLYKYWDKDETLQPVISVWPLRFLAIENRSQSEICQLKNREVDVLELETKVLAFARIGRPGYSKSRLLNSLLSSQVCNTFYNIDCPSGMTHRKLSNGHIEMFWLPTTGDKKDRFQDAMTFLNMRGNLKIDFNINILSFVADFVDAVTIIIDRESILKNATDTKAILLNFSSVMLVVAGPLRPDIVKAIQSLKSEVVASKPCINIRVLSTHKGVYEQNVVDMVSSISKHITSQLKSNCTKSFQERLNATRTDTVKTDENEQICQHARDEAETLVKQMKQEGESIRWKHLLTPVHSKYSKQLGKLMKKRKRENNFNAGETIDLELKQIRRLQTQSIKKSVKLFIDILLRNEKSHLKLKLFLCWLHFHIEREKRTILPELMFENRCAWEKLKTLKSEETKDQSEIENQEAAISQSEAKIEEASFSVEHFFREIGHIYEAILQLNETPSKFDLPQLQKIANIMGKLVADGHQLELIDGENFYMPYLWTRTILEQVDKSIDTSKVMTLSVLGLQSSGKSTLLNTMFGSQFSTRTGKCTRGIHLQLIPLKKTLSYKDILSPFNYVLLVDTEGLRSPELGHVQHEHDNELATFITGIGDVTMLNIMGENTSEIRDILQVIVHAFLRLKMTNTDLELRKCCAFIHQNVTDTSASENMISGLSKLIQTLDEMTKESARSEGIKEISTFNQVIEFDINSHVWYLKNLWQGNPPMARVNTEYSDKVVDMKCKVLQKALQMRNKSYKSLSDITEHAHNLWKGVLNEDFVFSFRNSLEIRAYMEMERVVQDELWYLESSIRDALVEITQTNFGGCDQKDDLRYIADKVIHDLKGMLAVERSKREKAIIMYFESSKFKDIIIQWKKSQHTRIDILCLKLEHIIREQIEKSVAKRSVEILTVANHETHEEELSRKSMEVANKYKGVKLTKNEMYDLFDNIWQSFIIKVDTTSYSTEKHRTTMKHIFKNCLEDKFKEHNALLKEILRKSSYLEPISNLKKLEGSFQDTGINESDISFTIWQKGKQLIRWSKAMTHISERVNQVYEAVDEKINIICKIDDEITEMTVNKLMHELDAIIFDVLTENTKYTFQKIFYVKIYVHVSRYAQHVFELHNDNYFKTQGTAVRLEQYKQQQKISFVAHLSNRRSEDIAARLFSHVIEIFAEEWTSQNLSNKVTDELHGALPCVKNRVIIEICTDLVDNGNFINFRRYLRAPKEYTSLWITEKANSHLFGHESRAYSYLAASLLNTVFRKVEESVRNLEYSYRGSTPSMERWINDFQESMKSKNVSIQPESFRNVKKEIEQIKNVEYLTDEILANLPMSENTLKSKFNGYNSMSVTWANTNPIDRIIKKIWGCSEQCGFCGEPCAKNEDHDGSVHYSIQHRPPCCNGISYERNNEATLESCEFQVQSKTTYKCQVLNYVCNKEATEACGKTHFVRDYKTYLPNWDIAPTSNMHDTSKFWMWFVATYKDKLHDYYEYDVSNVPSSWDAITKEEAKNSLQKTYSA